MDGFETVWLIGVDEVISEPLGNVMFLMVTPFCVEILPITAFFSPVRFEKPSSLTAAPQVVADTCPVGKGLSVCKIGYDAMSS